MLKFDSSEALASSIIHLLNVKMAKLQDVWDVIGIQEEKRLERMGSVKNHIEVISNKRLTQTLFFILQSTELSD